MKGVDDDVDILSALDWFSSVAVDHHELKARIHDAQSYYRSHSLGIGIDWPNTSRLLVAGDLVASYLAQADALVHDRRVYDLSLGSRIVPFIKSIGMGVEYLKTMPGAADRVRRMLKSNNDHPDSALFELVTAARYAHEGLDISFIAETNRRMGDLRIQARGVAEEIHVECKRLRPSMYELREIVEINKHFEKFSRLVHDRHVSVDVDVTFHVELQKVPNSYLADRVAQALACKFDWMESFSWRDGYGEGVVRLAKIERVRQELEDSSLLFGTKMARLLANRNIADGNYFMATNAAPRGEDQRYIDKVQYASVVSWHCLAPESIEARARHVRSKLADIDNQLEHADIGIAHIGMDAERDTVTADLRSQRNIETANTFAPKSQMLELHLHYFMGRVSEVTAWTIDESVQTIRAMPMSLLDDPKLLCIGQSEMNDSVLAWHLPPPEHS